MFNLYLQGLQWVLFYYYQGVKSWRWYYPYNYAPMISDFDNIDFDNKITDIFENDKSEPYSPFQSLLFILPKTSFDLLPKCYKDFPTQAPEYFPENVDIDYNGKHTPWEAVVLLPFLDEKKVLELEKKDRNLTKEEEIYDKWGKSFKFEKNDIKSDKDIVYNVYEIYQNKDYNMLTNYDSKKIDYTFPTLKTINYSYSVDLIKTYFGKNVKKTRRITIHPKLNIKIENNEQIQEILSKKNIFFGYPYKAFGRLEGLIIDKQYYYIYKDKLYPDKYFKYSTELENIINNNYSKQGIYLSHPDLLCNIAKFIGFKKIKGKMQSIFNEKAREEDPFYVPLEVTSLNAINEDFEEFLPHFNPEFKYEEKKPNIIIKKQDNKQEEINKLNIKQKFNVHEKFKKFPPEVRIDMEKKMKIITTGTTNVSEYRENRIFKDENIGEHQIYYYRNPNSNTNVDNPNLIIK
jgi:5'-3' exonuclease